MEREKKIIKTSALGIIVNIVLVAFKAVIGIITNSIRSKQLNRCNIFCGHNNWNENCK